MARQYAMWALFNTNRPPIFVQVTRRECVLKGIEWMGGERKFNRMRRQGWITIAKVTVRRSRISRGTEEKR